MNKPLVSILMPAYNVEAWIAQALNSALRQTWENIEVIVVDDGSVDSTLTVARSMKASNLKIIHQKNQGQSASENLAFQEAQGDYIVYLDADDLLAPDKIEKQMKLLNIHGEGYVYSCEWARFFTDPAEAKFQAQPLWADLSPVEWLITAWEGGWMMHGAAWLLPRGIVERAGPWNPELSLINDYDFFSRVLLASKGTRFCWDARTYYRSFSPQSANNLSSTRSLKAIQSALRAIELGTHSLLSVENSARTRHACATSYQRLAYSIYAQSPEISALAESAALRLGGTEFQPEGGRKFYFLSKLLGWKAAKQLQHLSSSGWQALKNG